MSNDPKGSCEWTNCPTRVGNVCCKEKDQTLCKSCAGLEMWPGIFSSRYLCGFQFGQNVKAFGRFGKPCNKGIPQVTACAKYQSGQHYSMKPR